MSMQKPFVIVENEAGQLKVEGIAKKKIIFKIRPKPKAMVAK